MKIVLSAGTEPNVLLSQYVEKTEMVLLRFALHLMFTCFFLLLRANKDKGIMFLPYCVCLFICL